MSGGNLAGQLAGYWSVGELTTNFIIFLNLLGALLLGSLVGYERAYHGRAAGMRTYGLVCMASAGLTVIAGYPGLWFGGQPLTTAIADPTRVIQGIVTGIGFLGAGVIVKEGLNISGLTTAASIWAASSIGVLIGVGFYAAAILLAALSAATMLWGSRIEAWLPSHPAQSVSLDLAPDAAIDAPALQQFFSSHGYEMAMGSFGMARNTQGLRWRFVVFVADRHIAQPMDRLCNALAALPGVQGVRLDHARN